GDCGLRRAVRHDRCAGPGHGSAVPSGEVLGSRPPAASQLRAAVRSAAGGCTHMILLPAIDILEAKTVRLTRGEFDEKTVYDTDPLDAARRWVGEGAHWLHVVDLDGARTGEPQNLDQVARIAQDLDVAIQVGGGLRTIDDIRDAI